MPSSKRKGTFTKDNRLNKGWLSLHKRYFVKQIEYPWNKSAQFIKQNPNALNTWISLNGINAPVPVAKYAEARNPSRESDLNQAGITESARTSLNKLHFVQEIALVKQIGSSMYNENIHWVRSLNKKHL